MLVAAAIHVALMMVKARNEESFLHREHGEAYAVYCAQTGRFFPRLGRRAPDAVRPR
jgi:protein-S-isoprenylcysteine O-methyltransferase Ste14